MTGKSCTPQSLQIVRSTLEVAQLLRRRYPDFEARIAELESEVESAGQLLIDAGSVARARLALERIRAAQLALEGLRTRELRLAA